MDESKIKQGFTLIELLVVISIIGLLSTGVYVATPQIMQRARDARITQDFHLILNLAEQINYDRGNYDTLCLGETLCNDDLQKVDKDIAKQKGTLVVQKPEISSQSYCAFSPLNSPGEGGDTQYYCVDSDAGKIKTTINPGAELCTGESFRCPTPTEQLAYEAGEGGAGFSLPPMTAQASVFDVSIKKYPYFREVTIDPLDVSVGDTQLMLVLMEDPDEISWVRADIEHDNGIDTVMLFLTDGDLTAGTWGGQWRVHSTHKETYHTTFTAQNRKGEQSSITLAWTDPCSFPVSGDVHLADIVEESGCSITTENTPGGVTGVDNGNFIIDGGKSITIGGGATLVFNPGKSITMAKDGASIMIDKTNGGGQIKKSRLWMADADGDGYASSTVSSQYYALTAPTVGGVTLVRRYNIASSTALDYNDRNSAIYYNTACESAGSANITDTYTSSGNVAATTSVDVLTSAGQIKLGAAQ